MKADPASSIGTYDLMQQWPQDTVTRQQTWQNNGSSRVNLPADAACNFGHCDSPKKGLVVLDSDLQQAAQQGSHDCRVLLGKACHVQLGQTACIQASAGKSCNCWSRGMSMLQCRQVHHQSSTASTSMHEVKKCALEHAVLYHSINM